MIQRVQTLFLLIASGCFGGSLAAPFASTPIAIRETAFADQSYTASDSGLLFALLLLACLLALAAIFLYRNRPLQRNLSWGSVILAVGALGFGIFLFMQQAPALGPTDVQEGFGAILPIAGSIASLFAVRGINKDERLVRSADRLR